MTQPGSDTNAYDVGASQTVQDDFATAAANLEAAINRHDADVKNAMAEYVAQEVSDAYHAMETTWKNAGGEVKDIITLLKGSLCKNDDVACQTMKQAMACIPS
jgi:hypothetical protein